MPVGSTTLSSPGTGAFLQVDTTSFTNLGDFNAQNGADVGVVLHEEGHYLGLGHGGPYNGNADPATQQFSAYDSHQYDLMSYVSADDPAGKYAASYPLGAAANPLTDSTTWMPLDILAVQSLYGVNANSPLSGGQVFGFNDNITGVLEPYFDFNTITNPFLTLYDTGTGNTLDLSGYSTAVTVNLNPGTFSSFNGMTNNMAIAYNTKIDGYVGDSGNDTVTTNNDADTLDGGGGTNAAVFSGALADYTLSQSGGVVTAIKNATAISDLLTNFQTLTFSDQSVQSSDVACFAAGTLILTDRGDVAVQDLLAGDVLVTANGAAEPIRWIGRRSYAGQFLAANPQVQPVRLCAGCLGEGLPRRDLLVSPKHAMLLDRMLVPAECLVNGITILHERGFAKVEYFHVELDAHGVLLAEGAPSETFVDDESRGMFHNAHEYWALFPNAPRRPARYCAPRVEGGAELEAVRRRLADVARGVEIETVPSTLRGFQDVLQPDRISGWAQDTANPDKPVRLRILDNGVVIGEVVADRYRADLQLAGIGNGRHSFELVLPDPLQPSMRHAVQVQFASNGVELAQSPQILEATAPLDGAADRGAVDLVTREQVAGWAWEPTEPGTPVALQILDNGVPAVRILANWFRADLQEAGIGDGRHSFDIRIPDGPSPFVRRVIEVKRERDGTHVFGSPWVIEASGSFDTALEQHVMNAVAALATPDEQARALSFMVAQSERLLQQRAAGEGQRAERLAYQQFRRRWGPEGGSHEARDPGLRALVVNDCIPVASRDAGSQAVLSHMRGLQRLGYCVSLVAAEQVAPAEADVAALAAIGVACFGKPFYASVEDVLRRQAGCFDTVYLHRADIAAGYLALARRCNPKARILYSVADLHHVRLERQATLEDCPKLLAASRRMRLTELASALAADAVLTHSVDEAALLRRALPQANVHHAPWDLPVRSSAVEFAARSGIAFIGGYDHAPNVDAAHWLVEAIMPLVWQVDPSIGCMLVGSGMPASVRQLVRPGVTVAGQVDDLGAAVFDKVRLTVAPLRFGAGVKGKVLESFAAGLPCVMTEIAAEGLTLPRSLQALVGGDAAALVRLICRMHSNRRVNLEVGSAGQALIRDQLNAGAVGSALQAALGIDPQEEAVDRRQAAVGA